MIAPAPGTLLIADQFLKDPNFLRTVVFICEHQDNGSFGFVLNKKHNKSLNDLIPGLDGQTIPLFDGGPVQTDTLHFLHQCPDEIPGGIEVMEDIFWGGDFDAVLELIRNYKLDLQKIRFFVGYSGWGNGQLINELNEKIWVTVSATRKLIFHKTPTEIWKDSLKHLGGDYSMMVNYPIDPQLN